MERDAIRAYLQRAENRLAILNGIAMAFVGGAALIVLGPFLFKEIILSTIANVVRVPAASNLLVHWYFGLAFLCLMAVLLVLVLLILCTILRQVVRLYFLPPQHNTEGRVDLPRFVLWPITLPTDDDSKFGKEEEQQNSGDVEVSETKKAVLRAFFRHEFHLEIISSFISKANRQRHRDFVTSSFKHSLNGIRERFISKEFENDQIDERVDPEDKPITTARMLNLFGSLAGVRDRTLLQEAARMEALLIRFHLQIRIVLIRYFQGLLIFFLFWGVLLLLSSLAEHFHDIVRQEWAQKPETKTAFVSIFYYAAFFCIQVLAFFVPPVTHLPIRWILGGKQVENPVILSMLDDRFSKLDRYARVGGLILSGVCAGAIFAMFIVLFKLDVRDSFVDKIEFPLLALAAFLFVVQLGNWMYIFIPIRRSKIA